MTLVDEHGAPAGRVRIKNSSVLPIKAVWVNKAASYTA